MNTSFDFVSQAALRSIRHSADLALEPAPRPAHLPDTYLGLSTQQIREWSLGRVIKIMVEKRGWGSYAGIERESNDALERKLGPSANAMTVRVPYEVANRALTVGVASSGGYLTDTVNAGFIELLRRRTLAYRLGAVPLPGLKSNINVPRLASGATAGPLGTETAQIAETDDSFGQLALTPKTYGSFSEVSRQLMLQSEPAIEMVVSNDLTKAAAVAIDNGFFNGTGITGQVLGALNTSNVLTTSGTTFIWATALTMQNLILDQNIPGERLAYVCHPDVAKLLAGRQRFASATEPLWQGSTRDGVMAGLPAASSVTIPTGTVLLVDFSEALIAEWGDLQISIDPFTKFAQAIVGIRAMWSFDVGFGHPAAICIATGVS
jgi:HK97 family phage major capsid protein